VTAVAAAEAAGIGQRLHPATFLIRFVKQIPEFVVGLPAVIGFASDAGWTTILSIALVGGSLSLLVALLVWLRFRYTVGDDEIVVESGVLSRQRRVIPFSRIQDLDIEQRLLHRLFGLAKVRIETGGSGSDEGNLDAIALDEAHRLREIVRRGRSVVVAPSEAAPELEAAEPILFQMNLRRVLVAGLFNFSLIYLAVIGGAFQYLEPLADGYSDQLKGWAQPSREEAARYGVMITAALILLVLFLGVLTGLFRTLARDYGYRLTRAPGGLRRRRGLFTLSEVVIPLRRVQVAILETGWFRRLFGWWSLQFQTLGTNAQQSGHQDVAPFARTDEILPLLGEAGVEHLPAESEYHRISRRAVARRYLSDILPLSGIVLLAGIFFPAALLMLVPLLVGAVAVVLQWRRHRYLLTDRAVYIREGVLSPRVWIVPFERLQVTSVRRTPLQRRFRLATLEIDTAGASIFRAPSIRDLERETAEHLASRLLDEYLRARRGAKRV